jgi:ribosomal protein L16/L10AE
VDRTYFSSIEDARAAASRALQEDVDDLGDGKVLVSDFEFKVSKKDLESARERISRMLHEAAGSL